MKLDQAKMSFNDSFFIIIDVIILFNILCKFMAYDYYRQVNILFLVIKGYFIIQLFQKITHFFISFVLEKNICLNVNRYVNAIFLAWKDGFIYLKKGEEENEKQKEVC